MRPEILQGELIKILESSFSVKQKKRRDDYVLSLTEDQMFKLWNVLGEELGIDLALASENERQMLLESCRNGKSLRAKDFGSLLWLVYYSDANYQ